MAVVPYEVYRAVVFVHVFAALLFMLAHGASAATMFRMMKERNATKLSAMLELSESTAKWMGAAAAVMLFSGIAVGPLSPFESWRYAWYYVSIVLLVVLSILMSLLGRLYFHKVRKVVGLPYDEMGKKGRQPALDPAGEEEIAKIVATGRPTETALLGYAVVGILLYLMMFKPGAPIL